MLLIISLRKNSTFVLNKRQHKVVDAYSFQYKRKKPSY